MRKRSLLAVALLATTLGASAQNALKGTKFGDNWSLGVTGGVTSSTTQPNFWHKGSKFRPLVGLEFGKQISPIYGLSVEALGGINTIKDNDYAFDHLDVTLLNKINLMNLFGGYLGRPRTFEMEAVGGVGYRHGFVKQGDDLSETTAKFGLNFNFNLGQSKAWTVSLKPAISYELGNGRLSKDASSVQLLAGLTYHFKGSNGERYMTYVREYDQAEVDGLNGEINGLRARLNGADQALANKDAEIARLRGELEACQNAPKPAAVVKRNELLESVVTYRQGSAVVTASQLPNVERIATYLKKYPNAKVVVKGYASPEGSKELNERLAQKRAESVKNLLVKKYKISADRITASGEGIGDMFSEPDWNRVSISTIEQ